MKFHSFHNMGRELCGPVQSWKILVQKSHHFFGMTSVAAQLSERVRLRKKGSGSILSPSFVVVGDAGFEPTAFGSGDQRSIQLS
jgi:hypothetical protein